MSKIDKSLWNGILVCVDYIEDRISDITLELIGKAKELGVKANESVYCLVIGKNVESKIKELKHYGIDKIFYADDNRLEDFKIEPYLNIYAKVIEEVKPSSVLFGATSIGLSLAPSVAAYFKTGLTANCTILDINENGDLVQTRPAFGGNIMADMLTTDHRPQMVTVREKAMDKALYNEEEYGEVVEIKIKESEMKSSIEIVEKRENVEEDDLASAKVIIVAGRGVRNEADMKMLETLATLLDGKIGVTRPLVEKGFAKEHLQIGVSGRIVRPKLLIACGVSGDIQFSAGIMKSDCIVAINNDKDAPIFEIANCGIVGDMYEVVPELIEKIKLERGN